MFENKALIEEFTGEFEIIFYSSLAIIEEKGTNNKINDFSWTITDNPIFYQSRWGFRNILIKLIKN